MNDRAHAGKSGGRHERTDTMDGNITATPAESFGAAVRALRETRGMSQLELGRAMGAYRGMVKRMEESTLPPRRDRIARLSEALDLTTHERAWLAMSRGNSRHTREEWIAIQEGVLTRAQAGDIAAFDLITTQFTAAVRATLYRTLGEVEGVEDLSQQTFLRAWQSIGRFACDSANGLLNWLLKIANNLALDVLRRNQRIRMIPDCCLPIGVRDWWWNGLEAHERGPDSITAGRETIAQVRAVMARISERHRVALMLREYDGLSCEQMGARMADYNTHSPGVPMTRQAIKSVLYRARIEFKQVWLSMYGEAMVA